jgi:hypothetical protein
MVRYQCRQIVSDTAEIDGLSLRWLGLFFWFRLSQLLKVERFRLVVYLNLVD